MLRKGEYHYGRDAVNHEKKMEQYRKFLKKNGINFEKFLAKTAWLFS
jgi:hypothetical protein